MTYIMKYLIVCICMFTTSIIMAEEPNEKQHVVSAVAPIFPSDCYLTGTSGKIKLRLTVNAEGDVIDTLTLETSAPFLIEDSINAVRQWRFSTAPGKSDSQKFVVTFYFRIMPDQTPKDELTVIYRLPFELEIRGRAKTSIREEMPAATHDQ
jgi:hypothetical protein